MCENHSFIPGLNDIVFSAWKQKGIDSIHDSYISTHTTTKINIYNITALRIRDDIRKNFVKS